MAALTNLDRARVRSGLTLIELVISIAIFGIALGGALLAVDQTTVRSADPMLQQQASAIAEAYLEEILLKSFLDPDSGTVCPAAEASRDLYDNVCDYAGLDDSGAQDQSGSVVAGLESYRVRVGVDTTAALNGLTGSADVLRVDVRVSHGSRVDLTLSGYRTRY
jgi:MSHA pilin protein MshD